MKIKVDIKRVYDEASDEDDYRILVDRLWPRGVKKAALHFDLWCKELAPSPELRKWFGHKPERWQKFRHQYETELQDPEKASRLRELIKEANSSHITLLYGARDEQHNHALILADEIARVAKPLRKARTKKAKPDG